MTPERWQQPEDLFQVALECEPEQRSAFLAASCAGDPRLRQEIEALLASFERASGFLEEPAAAAFGPAGNPAGSAVGRRIGHYEILSLLGAGGMGKVHLAHDSRLDRRIALKLLPVHFTQDPELVARFKREARAASATNHPNIITVYEIGQEADLHFIATEFVAGQTLRQKITSAGMEMGEAIRVALQIAGALEAAHAAGIVHRDIKPENIMVRPDGLAKVLDFGLAKPITQEPKRTSAPLPSALSLQTDPGTLMGTVAYPSPEQVRRQKVDHRTDIFSLGVVLYETNTSSNVSL